MNKRAAAFLKSLRAEYASVLDYPLDREQVQSLVVKFAKLELQEYVKEAQGRKLDNFARWLERRAEEREG